MKKRFKLFIWYLKYYGILKEYRWISKYKAKFKINNKKYYSYFNKIVDGGYHHYFCLNNNDREYFDINEHDNCKFFDVFFTNRKIFYNFIKRNRNLKFIYFTIEGIDSFQLHTLYLSYMKKWNKFNENRITDNNGKEYFFIYDDNIDGKKLNEYLQKII